MFIHTSKEKLKNSVSKRLKFAQSKNNVEQSMGYKSGHISDGKSAIILDDEMVDDTFEDSHWDLGERYDSKYFCRGVYICRSYYWYTYEIIRVVIWSDQELSKGRK